MITFLAIWKKRDEKIIGKINRFLNISVHDKRRQIWRVNHRKKNGHLHIRFEDKKSGKVCSKSITVESIYRSYHVYLCMIFITWFQSAYFLSEYNSFTYADPTPLSLKSCVGLSVASITYPDGKPVHGLLTESWKCLGEAHQASYTWWIMLEMLSFFSTHGRGISG